MFQVPDAVKKGLEDYKRSLADFQNGKISSSRFKGVRVPWGIYSHRGGKTYMMRIRVPAGVITARQLKALAAAARKYGDGSLHLTTRQDVQIHNVSIEDTVSVMEELKDYDLSPRGGGGNTVRNITGCALAGVCREEIFDIRPYASGLTEFLLADETSFNLPRKFKISFSGCAKDCSGCLFNDVGLVAVDHQGKKGFTVFAGGGMGAKSRLGRLLEVFIPEADPGYCITAVKRVFYRQGDRRNKHHNRLRFLIEDIGFEEFKESYLDELQRIKRDEYIGLRRMKFPAQSETDDEIPLADDPDYKEFLRYNVRPQKQKGFVIAELRIPRGDISSEQMAALGDLESNFPGIEFRTSQNQNLFICWVKARDTSGLSLELKHILPDFLYPGTLLDVVCCKGALTCNLGLCNSPGLAEKIEETIKRDLVGTRVFKELEVKLNGCPNSCGQHPLGKISLHGLVKRVDNKPVPFYKLLLGGKKDAESSLLAEAAGIMPARNVPGFLKDFFLQLENLLREKSLYDLLAERGRDIAGEVLKKYSYVPPCSEDESFYIDWGKKERFSLAGLGQGECGAGILDMIDSDLAEAKINLEEAERSDYSASLIKKALFLSARSLLIVKGCDPGSEEEAFQAFKEKFIETGIVGSKFADIAGVFTGLSMDLSFREREKSFLYVKEFLASINLLYKSMDSSFNFPTVEQSPAPDKEDANEKDSGSILDLKGTPCPLNYARAKLVIEKLAPGDILEMFLDEGEPIYNVPRNLKDDGHQILNIEKKENFYRVLVKKK